MNGSTSARLRTEAWLLRGISSLPGQLRLERGRLSFEAFDSGSFWSHQLVRLEQETARVDLADRLERSERAVVFDVPLSQVTQRSMPWYYLSGGVKLCVNGIRYRIAFVRPNGVSPRSDLDASLWDIGEGRRRGRAWKRLLFPPEDENAIARGGETKHQKRS